MGAEPGKIPADRGSSRPDSPGFGQLAGAGWDGRTGRQRKAPSHCKALLDAALLAARDDYEGIVPQLVMRGPNTRPYGPVRQQNLMPSRYARARQATKNFSRQSGTKKETKLSELEGVETRTAARAFAHVHGSSTHIPQDGNFGFIMLIFKDPALKKSWKIRIIAGPAPLFWTLVGSREP